MYGINSYNPFQSTGINTYSMYSSPLAMYSNASMLMGSPLYSMAGGSYYSGMMGSMMMENMMPMLMQQIMMQQMQAMVALSIMQMMQQQQMGINSGMPYTGLSPSYLPSSGFSGYDYGNQNHSYNNYSYGNRYYDSSFSSEQYDPANLSGKSTSLDDVPWFSQFDSSHVPGAGSMACFRASVAMAKAGGATVLGPNARIQVATAENGSGNISVNKQNAIKGREYIDNQLEKGKPVVVGVSYAAGRDYNVDHITDHFVTITGKGVDEQGRTYYTFNDPGTTNKKTGSDDNKYNRFYVDSKTGKMYRPPNNSGTIASKDYEISMVRRNA